MMKVVELCNLLTPELSAEKSDAGEQRKQKIKNKKFRPLSELESATLSRWGGSAYDPSGRGGSERRDTIIDEPAAHDNVEIPAGARKPKLIVYIPSGGGKTTLTTAYPYLYSDPDDIGAFLSSMSPQKAARFTDADWEERNRRIRDMYSALPPNKDIILSWHPRTLPVWMRRGVRQVVVLPPANDVRLNQISRQSLIDLEGAYDRLYLNHNQWPRMHSFLKAMTYVAPSDAPQGQAAFTGLEKARILLPDFVNASVKLGKGGHPTAKDYEALISGQDSLDLYHAKGLIDSRTYTYLLESAYAGQKHDIWYQSVNVRDPSIIEENRTIEDAINRGFSGSLRHSLPIYDTNTILHKRTTKRTIEYATVKTAEIEERAIDTLQVVVCDRNLCIYLFGREVPTLPDVIPQTGLYRTTDSERIPNGSMVRVSYYSAYFFYKNSGAAQKLARKMALTITKTRPLYEGERSAKIGLSKDTGYKGTPKYRPFGRAAKDWHKLMTAGLSALEAAVVDKQTLRRAHHTEQLRIERGLDGSRILKHDTDPAIQLAIRKAVSTVFNQVLDGCVDPELLSYLWPEPDPEIGARTRVDNDLLAKLLPRVPDLVGVAYTRTLLYTTGGLTQQAFAGLVMATLAGKKSALLINALLQAGFASHGIKHWVETTKAIHTLARRSHSLPHALTHLRDVGNVALAGQDWATTELMYLNTLGGRIQDELLANDGFVAKRLPVPAAHFMPGIEGTRQEQCAAWDESVRSSMTEMQLAAEKAIARKKDMTPAEFHAQFIQLAPPGSVNQLKEKAFKWVKGDMRDVHKRLLLDSLPTEFMWEALDEYKPQLFTNAQAKTETAAKLRQIVPGPDVHWLIESMAVYSAEEGIYRLSQEFTLETDPAHILGDIEERRIRTMLKNVTVASDYADFNFLHLIPEMKKWWASIRAAAAKHTGPGDWNGTNYPGHVVKCCDWLMAALDAMYVREVGGDGKFYLVRRGLWSGWRTTSLINNSFNYIYAKAIRADVARILGFDPVVKYRLNGDDGDALMRGVAAGLLYLRHLNLAELDIQAEKQLVTRMCTEYLRILTEDGKVYGSMYRSISSFIGSDLQAPVVDKGQSYVSGTSTAMNMLVRRGFDESNMDLIRDDILLHFASVKTQKPDGTTVVAQLRNVDALYVPASQGGFGCVRIGQTAVPQLATAMRWPNLKARKVIENAPHFGVKAMMSQLYVRFSEAGLDTSVLAAVEEEAKSVVASKEGNEFNRASDNYVRLKMAEHIEKLNNSKVAKLPKTKPNGPEPSVIKDTVRTAILRLLDGDAEAIRREAMTPLDEAVSRQVARVLGLASITPNIIMNFRDASTGRALGFKEVAGAMGMRLPVTDLLDALYPSQVIELGFDNAIIPNRDVRDVMGAELQPIIDIIQAECLRACWTVMYDKNDKIQQYNNIIEWCNYYIVHHFNVRYRTIYRL
uniref:RNA-directed RNA polymerase n=1 Tax=Rhizoctonia solani phlegivirus 7 TaxID=3162551 RepID=A0AAU6NE17_9VIRU